MARWTLNEDILSVLVLTAWFVMPGPASAATGCTGKGIEVQVLGSGGPELQDKRASSSYVVWRDGHARVLIDAGGGSALRFGESDARMEDLAVILLSHLHIDHTADLPALLKSSYFGERKDPLPIFGPPGNSDFPATTIFIADLFDPRHGAWRYLGPFLSGKDGGYRVRAHDVSLGAHEIRQVFAGQGIVVSATRAIHGTVPALAWRVDVDGHSVAFSGDNNGNNGNLEKLAAGVDLLIAHNAIPEGTGGAPRELHMPPSVIGAIAHAAGVHQLALSHRMLRSSGHEEVTRAAIARNYAGRVLFADDLDCFPLRVN